MAAMLAPGTGLRGITPRLNAPAVCGAPRVRVMTAAFHGSTGVVSFGAAALTAGIGAKKKSKRSRALRASPQEEEYWSSLSEEQRAQMAEEMDSNAPYRYLLLFLAALLVGKALPDAVFSYLRNLAGIRGAVLDPQMLAFDALLCGLGVGLAYAALTLLGPPEIPTSPKPSAVDEMDEDVAAVRGPAGAPRP
mmetsp:Transcript_30245/g.67858  ORF Transcript_30245/g.67858 Transcript_30245/m.67858 type:complete len:192 (+) Transcript_30245:18-593(+)